MIADLLPALATEERSAQLVEGFDMPLGAIADLCAADWEFKRYLHSEALRLPAAIRA